MTDKKPHLRLVQPPPNSLCYSWKCRKPRYVVLPPSAAEGMIVRADRCSCGELYVVVRDKRTP